MKKIALISFFIVALGELISIAVQLEQLHLVCKPLIMVTLGAYYLSSVGENRSLVVLLAIIFSLAGDVSLMFDSIDSIYFIIGLISFLISHVFYIVAYRQHQYDEQSDSLQGIQKLRAAFPIVLAGTGLVVILYPTLGDLKFPVVVYALVLVVMVLRPCHQQISDPLTLCRLAHHEHLHQRAVPYYRRFDSAYPQVDYNYFSCTRDCSAMGECVCGFGLKPGLSLSRPPA
jgi:uncharacterized membrane protein YhhN